MTLSILLADDHMIFRESLRLLLQRDADFQVVGEAADGVQAVMLVDSLEPQAIVLDLSMPGLNGLEAIRLIKAGARLEISAGRRISFSSKLLIVFVSSDTCSGAA